MQKNPPPEELDALIAGRVGALRQARGLSLAALADRSGVSKAMISRVERGDSSPTAMILGRLAAGLGVSLTGLLAQEADPVQPLRKRAAQQVWRDPQTGYRRRQVAPRDLRTGVELVEVELPRGARVDYPPWAANAYSQRVWLVEGALQVSHGEAVFKLEPGDCLDFGVDCAVSFRATGGRACRYLLVIQASRSGGSLADPPP